MKRLKACGAALSVLLTLLEFFCMLEGILFTCYKFRGAVMA